MCCMVGPDRKRSSVGRVRVPSTLASRTRARTSSSTLTGPRGDTIRLQSSGFRIAAGSQVFQGDNFFHGAGVTPTTLFATLYRDTNTNPLQFDGDGTSAGGADVVTFLAGSPILTPSDIVFA